MYNYVWKCMYIFLGAVMSDALRMINKKDEVPLDGEGEGRDRGMREERDEGERDEGGGDEGREGWGERGERRERGERDEGREG